MRNDVRKFLQVQDQKLREIESRLSERLRKSPEGSLHINHFSGNVKYYHYLKKPASGQKEKRYLRKDQQPLIMTLAQKDYDTVLLRLASSQRKTIQNFLRSYQPEILKDVYAKLPAERKSFVTPSVPDDETYARQWKSEAYSPGPWKEDAVHFDTLKGDRVRSKTEKIIADTLYLAGIPYRYEYPLVLNDGRIWHPDFTVLNKRTREEFILDHFGLMDNNDYCNHALSKLRIYAQNGYYPGEKLLVTFETKTLPFSTGDFDLLIRHYFL